MNDTTTTMEIDHRLTDVPCACDRIYVWDLVVRTTHWLIFLSIVVLSVTGFYIGHPFVKNPTSTGALTMAWFKTVHFYTAIVFTCAVLARVFWMFLGPRWARWNQFLPVTAKRWRNIRDTFLFYIMAKHNPPEDPGHNGLAGLTYVGVFGLYFLAIVTGLAIYSVDASVGSYMKGFEFLLPIFGGAQSARWVHHVVMWLLLGFMVHHLYSAMLISVGEKNATIESMFSGLKFMPCWPKQQERERREEEEREAQRRAKHGGGEDG